MFELAVENSSGQRLPLTGSAYFTVVDVQGLFSCPVTVNRSQVYGAAGSVFKSAKIGERNITILIKIEHPVEKNRNRLYKYFRGGDRIRLFYKNGMKDVYIDGYVESPECNFFTVCEQTQFSIICPDPYFKSVQDIELSFTKDASLFEFPFAIAEVGIPFSEYKISDSQTAYIDSVPSGCIITVKSVGSWAISKPTITNVTAGQSMTVDIRLEPGEILTINSIAGEKGIYKTGTDGVTQRAIGYMAEGSSWLTLAAGENVIGFELQSGGYKNADVRLRAVNCYEGV